MRNLYLITLLFVSTLFISSCGNDNSENINAVSTNTQTTNNNTINGDTSKKNSPEVEIAEALTAAAKDFYDGWEKKDSIRDANEENIWVYLIGDVYDDDDQIAKEYDKLIQTEKDIFIFKKKRKKYYLMKGNGFTSEKEMDDSLSVVQNRIQTRLSVVNLSKMCRGMPKNAGSIKYKVDGEKKEAECKTCE